MQDHLTQDLLKKQKENLGKPAKQKIERTTCNRMDHMKQIFLTPHEMK